MPRSFLAVDLGAESGRAVLGLFDGKKVETREIRRFSNEPVTYRGSLHWDVPRLWLEVTRALNDLGSAPLDGIGVDGWGVDYALLSASGELLGNPHHYRDGRTQGVMDEVFQRASPKAIYDATGIQFMPINTLFQVYAGYKKSPELFGVAATLLTIPDLLHHWMCGEAVCEYTNATTTQMVNAHSGNWDVDLLAKAGLPTHMLASIVEPGSILGRLLPCANRQLAGTKVIAPACHDTASAVATVSSDGDTAFLSSGTWSLLGKEVAAPIINDEARQCNFTNEGGVCGTTRFLKNVMGLWLLQGCRASFANRGEAWSYEQLAQAAEAAEPFRSLMNPDDIRFLNPACMTTAVADFCKETGQPRPESAGQFARAVLESLAFRCAYVLGKLEQLTNSRISKIRIMGGGSRNDLLNQFIADATECSVIAGPVEATALGNIAMQMLATGAVHSLEEARAILDHSVERRVFEPKRSDAWQQQKQRFEQYQ